MMIPPMIAHLHIYQRRRGGRFRLWLPIFLLWALLLPFAAAVLPVVAVIVAALGRNPFAVFAAYWGVLCALSGSRVEIDTGRAFVFVQVT